MGTFELWLYLKENWISNLQLDRCVTVPDFLFLQRPNPDTGNVKDHLRPALFAFGNKFQASGMLNPAILWFSFCMLLVNNSPSLLLLTTAWLDDDEATGLPVGSCQPIGTSQVHPLKHACNDQSHEVVTQTTLPMPYWSSTDLAWTLMWGSVMQEMCGEDRGWAKEVAPEEARDQTAPWPSWQDFALGAIWACWGQNRDLKNIFGRWTMRHFGVHHHCPPP